jgi:hypothetical protein
VSEGPKVCHYLVFTIIFLKYVATDISLRFLFITSTTFDSIVLVQPLIFIPSHDQSAIRTMNAPPAPLV